MQYVEYMTGKNTETPSRTKDHARLRLPELWERNPFLDLVASGHVLLFRVSH